MNKISLEEYEAEKKAMENVNEKVKVDLFYADNPWVTPELWHYSRYDKSNTEEQVLYVNQMFEPDLKSISNSLMTYNHTKIYIVGVTTVRNPRRGIFKKLSSKKVKYHCMDLFDEISQICLNLTDNLDDALSLYRLIDYCCRKSFKDESTCGTVEHIIAENESNILVADCETSNDTFYLKLCLNTAVLLYISCNHSGKTAGDTEHNSFEARRNFDIPSGIYQKIANWVNQKEIDENAFVEDQQQHMEESRKRTQENINKFAEM